MAIVPDAANPIILAHLTAWLQSGADAQHDERVHEFGDCQFLLSRRPEGGVGLSLSISSATPESVQEACAAAYKGIARLTNEPLPGFQATLDINMRMLSRLPPAQQEFWIREIASVRLAVTSGPLRYLNHYGAAKLI